MVWQPEDLTAQLDGVEDTFTTTFSRVLGQITVYHNLSRLDGALFAEINGLQIQLTFVPLATDTLYVQYLTDQTVDGRIVGSGQPPPPGPSASPEALIDILDSLDNRIDYLEQEEFFTRDPKNTARAASVANVSVAYDPTGGILGTGSISGAPTSVDGVTLVDDDRVLLKDQTDGTQNGIWRAVDASAGDWVRGPDFDEDHKVTQGARLAIAEGAVNKESGWLLVSQDPLVVGTALGSVLDWRRLSSGSAGILEVVEEDGSPSVQPTTKLIVPNNSLSEPSPGEAKLDLAGQRVRNEVPAGLINDSNTTFTTANDFFPGSEAVHFNGTRQTEGAGNDYVRSESGGVGTGYDTITFAVAPRDRAGAKPDDRVAVDYDLT